MTPRPTNLTQLKKYIKIGLELDTFHLIGNRDLGRGKVSVVQGNCFAVLRGGDKPGYCPYPKAGDIKFDNDGFTVSEQGEPILRYTYVNKE